MNKTKIYNGFTLIELLVVIAIIGILAGILFVAIDPKKQNDEAVEKKALAQLAEVDSMAALIASENSDFSFDEVDLDDSINNLVDDITSNDVSWAAVVDLPNDETACRDSSGYYGTEKTEIELISGKYVCSEGEDEGGDEEGEEGEGDEEEGESNCDAGENCCDSGDDECCNEYDNDPSNCTNHGCEFDEDEEGAGGDCHG